MNENSLAPLYLSRLFLNRNSRQVVSEIAQPYEMHRTLMRAFPDSDKNGNGARSNFGVLFRAETQIQEECLKVYVQSLQEPNWAFLHLLDGYPYTKGNAMLCEQKNIMPFLKEIRKGDCFSFRLRANPTKRVARRDDPLKGKRVEITKEDEQITWLVRKGKERENNKIGGFEVLSRDLIKNESRGSSGLIVTASTEGKLVNSKRSSGVGHRVTHQSVIFEGLLRVTDDEAFLETIKLGIGSAKSFGFGLLSITPIK